MDTKVVGGAFLPHAPQFFTLPETEDKDTVARVKKVAQKIGDKFLVKQTKKPSMLLQERKNLEKIYEIEVKNLQNLLNRKLPLKAFQ